MNSVLAATTPRRSASIFRQVASDRARREFLTRWGHEFEGPEWANADGPKMSLRSEKQLFCSSVCRASFMRGTMIENPGGWRQRFIRRNSCFHWPFRASARRPREVFRTEEESSSGLATPFGANKPVALTKEATDANSG